MGLSVTIGDITDVNPRLRVIKVITKWKSLNRQLAIVEPGGRFWSRGTESVTYCVLAPHVDGRYDSPPRCPFITLIERWAITDVIATSSDQLPYTNVGPRQRWAVGFAADLGLVLVVQVAGEIDPSVPTGAFSLPIGRD